MNKYEKRIKHVLNKIEVTKEWRFGRIVDGDKKVEIYYAFDKLDKIRFEPLFIIFVKNNKIKEILYDYFFGGCGLDKEIVEKAMEIYFNKKGD